MNLELVDYPYDKYDFIATSIGDLYFKQKAPSVYWDGLGIALYDNQLHFFNEDDGYYWSIGTLSEDDLIKARGLLKQVLSNFDTNRLPKNNTIYKFSDLCGKIKKRSYLYNDKRYTNTSLIFRMCGSDQHVMYSQEYLEGVLRMFELKQNLDYLKRL